MPTLFEIHITTTELDEVLLQEFVRFCAIIKAKPILIELPLGQQRQQPMISKVVKLEDPQEIHPLLVKLKAAFLAAGFPVERVKVEVPATQVVEGKSAFHTFQGGYYEWHGKVKVEDSSALQKIVETTPGRLSRSCLKGASNQRIITVRGHGHRHYFDSNVNSIKLTLSKAGYKLIKEEAEYCVYDDNKKPDRGWLDVPEITQDGYRSLIAFEGIIRRAAVIKAPFMLKGSLVLRQYFDDPTLRIAGDMDFVYLQTIHDETQAAKVFSEWATEVTLADVNDGLSFRDFRENLFWRKIDYAMNDDFPTVNTDLLCTLKDGSTITVQLDISWNLPIPVSPVSLNYRPLSESNFEVFNTVPIPLQISWKMHQAVVAPRSKDLVDVILLLEAYTLVEKEREAVRYAFTQECLKDGISTDRIKLYTEDTFARYLELEEMDMMTDPPEMRLLEEKLSVLKDSSVDFFGVDHLHLVFPGLGRRFPTKQALIRTFANILLANGLEEL